MIYLNNGKGIVRRTDSIQLMDGNHFQVQNINLESASDGIPSNSRITESDDNRITESGDTRIIE